jgi:hypothetical protein
MEAEVVVYRPGSMARFVANPAVEVLILQCTLLPGDCVRYQVAYWKMADRVEVWVEGMELEGTKGTKVIGIGFRSD